MRIYLGVKQELKAGVIELIKFVLNLDHLIRFQYLLELLNIVGNRVFITKFSL